MEYPPEGPCVAGQARRLLPNESHELSGTPCRTPSLCHTHSLSLFLSHTLFLTPSHGPGRAESQRRRMTYLHLTRYTDDSRWPIKTMVARGTSKQVLIERWISAVQGRKSTFRTTLRLEALHQRDTPMQPHNQQPTPPLQPHLHPRLPQCRVAWSKLATPEENT